MAPRRKHRREEDPATDSPLLEQTDLDALAGDAFDGGRSPDEADLPYYVEIDDDADAPEENDDNAYQNSDEALPDDENEHVLARNPSKTRVRFNGV